METHTFLQYAVIFLLAAVISVPLARRFGLGAVLGYLVAGALIGPQGLKLIFNVEQTAKLSELGVVLLLFVIGLELSPQRVWLMRRAVFGAGTLQVTLSALLLGGIAVLCGLNWESALVIGLGLTLSSTAIAVQILADRKELNHAHGRLGLAILLFQDVAAIPILALIPLLGAATTASNVSDPFAVLRVVLVISTVIIGGRYLLRPVFRAVARAQTLEMFTATALLVVFGTAWLMQLAGISMALGAFIAGVLLADSEFRHEIESHIEPFKGLLLGLFFMGVGMSVDMRLALLHPLLIALLVTALLLSKTLVLLALGRGFGKLDFAATLNLAILLSGGGEFAFVVFNLAQDKSLLSAELHALLVVVVTLSMALTPLSVLLGNRWLANRKLKPGRAFDQIDEHSPRVIIAGFGRVGQIVARILRAQNIPFTALENSIEQVDMSRRFGNQIYFGDPSRADLLRSARADRAEIFVLATDDPEANVRTARLVKRQYPHLKIVARSRNRQHTFRLMDLNVDRVVRETLYSSLEMAQHVLEGLGLDSKLAKDRVEKFRTHDEELLKTQYLMYDDEVALVQSSKDALVELGRLFEADSQ